MIVPKRMLKPCANISILPGARFGSIASLYSFAAVVSGTSTMITSAHFETAATSSTSSPAACALARDRLAAGSPTFTLTPLSLQVQRMRVPLRSVADHRDLLALDQAEVRVLVVVHRRHSEVLLKMTGLGLRAQGSES